MKKFKILFSILVILVSCQLMAQNNKVAFSGQGRALFENDKLGAYDTVNNDRVNSGYMLTDLGFDIKPNSTTEIQAMIRLRNEYGGFYGQGASLDFRQLYIKGLVAKIIKYQFGDINIGLTPYTFYNSDGEGEVNESSAFKMLRNLNEYDNFNLGNTWRQQGGQAEFFLKIPNLIETIKFNTFITRNRGSFNTLSELLYGGGNISIVQSKNLGFNANYVNLFSLGETSDLDERVYNPVVTGDICIKSSNEKIFLKGEVGSSIINNKNSPYAVNKSDYFYEISLGSNWNNKLTKIEIAYRNVGPEFFSAGAQTKRIDFSKFPGLFPIVANGNVNRQISIFDLTRDYSIYNQIIGLQLMTFDVRYNNSMPYGVATPNRKGGNITIKHSDSLGIFAIQSTLCGLQEINGEGTIELRNFLLSRTKIDFNINRLLTWNKNLKLSGGYQVENTTRKGDTLSQVKLSSQLIDAGLEIELLDKFDVLAGAKLIMSKGNEFNATRDEYNYIIDYAPIKINSQETLWGGGVRYRFSSNIFLSVQGHLFKMKNKNVLDSDYDFSQIFILYNMKF